MFHRLCILGGSTLLLVGFLTLNFSLPENPLRAQPGPKKVREEEEEPEKSKVPAKIEDVHPKEPASVARQPLPQGTFNIAQEAAKARNPQVKDFLRRLAIPYDNLISAAGKTYKIGLLPERRLPEGKITYLELNSTLLAGKEKELASGAGFSLQPYEEIVLEDVDSLLRKEIRDLSNDEATELCVQVLQATRRFHAFAVDQKKRVGKDWEAVDEQLRKRIVRLRRDQLEAAVAAKDWKKADALSLELSNYADDPGAQKDIYRLLLQKEIQAMHPDRDEDYFKVRDAVNQFETIGGGRGEELALAAHKKLTERAQFHVDRAKKFESQKDNVAAFKALKDAEALDPDLASIQQLRSVLRGRILYVGVPRLPELMSPARARSDPERWAVELLFEGLMQAVPDAELGRKYRPMLAAAMPKMAPLGREFMLARNIRWAGDGNREVDARDVFGTLELLHKFPALPCCEGLEVIDTNRVRIEDPFRMRLNFQQGVLEPLNRTTFKVLPARYLKSQNKEATDTEFARRPFGTGPYRYEGREQEGSDREVAVFRANPSYSQRRGKFGLPIIREIRFVVPKLSSASADIAGGQLHMVLDVPTGELARYTADPLSKGQVLAAKTQINRRIWVLAVNHRRSALQDVSLRRGIAAAIDRDKILNMELFRPGGDKSLHVALTGPFPPQSWATPEKARRPEAALYSRGLAAGLFAEVAARGKTKLTLKFPEGDNQASQACAKIKEQIEDAAKKSPADAAAIEIDLMPVAQEAFDGQVIGLQDFDLAYVPLDYRDDMYSLSGLFDPAAGEANGRNFMGYLAPGSNPQPDDNDFRLALDEIRAHRDFKSSIREETWRLHARFLNRMPFVPLWQLDRYMVVQQGLDIYLDNGADRVSPERIDPARVFTGVENWRLR